MKSYAGVPVGFVSVILHRRLVPASVGAGSAPPDKLAHCLSCFTQGNRSVTAALDSSSCVPDVGDCTQPGAAQPPEFARSDATFANVRALSFSFNGPPTTAYSVMLIVRA
jgi:hypothetical protein